MKRSVAYSLTLALVMSQGVSAQTAEVILPGDSALRADVIQPHRAEWRLLVLRGGEESEAARFIREIEYVNHTQDEPAILTRWHFISPTRSGLDIYYLDRETLAPFARYVTSPNGIWVQYQTEGRLVATLTRRAGGDPVSIELELPSPRFNNAMVDFVLAALPLSEGMEARWPTLSTSASTIEDVLDSWSEIAVRGREVITLAAGESVETWIVELQPAGGNRQRVWISSEPPYLIQREVIGRDGKVSARWELVEVRLP